LSACSRTGWIDVGVAPWLHSGVDLCSPACRQRPAGLKFAHVVPADAAYVLTIAGLLLAATVFAAVHHAEVLALKLVEPFGSILLRIDARRRPHDRASGRRASRDLRRVHAGFGRAVGGGEGRENSLTMEDRSK
jgi:hypothetical protein